MDGAWTEWAAAERDAYDLALNSSHNSFSGALFFESVEQQFALKPWHFSVAYTLIEHENDARTLQ